MPICCSCPLILHLLLLIHLQSSSLFLQRNVNEQSNTLKIRLQTVELSGQNERITTRTARSTIKTTTTWCLASTYSFNHHDPNKSFFNLGANDRDLKDKDYPI